MLSYGQHVLEFRVLGEFEVVRDGATVTLPPSRKTRALLAYLALSRQKHRRERLCEIFWDVPDDPRGALRWSLSKIRPLIDDPAHPRLIADRNSVELRTEALAIDLLFCASLRRRRRRGDIRPGAGRLFLPRSAAGRSRLAGKQRIPELAVEFARGRAEASDANPTRLDGASPINPGRSVALCA
jgi:hypothetical protein